MLDYLLIINAYFYLKNLKWKYLFILQNKSIFSRSSSFNKLLKLSLLHFLMQLASTMYSYPPIIESFGTLLAGIIIILFINL